MMQRCPRAHGSLYEAFVAQLFRAGIGGRVFELSLFREPWDQRPLADDEFALRFGNVAGCADERALVVREASPPRQGLCLPTCHSRSMSAVSGDVRVHIA